MVSDNGVESVKYWLILVSSIGISFSVKIEVKYWSWVLIIGVRYWLLISAIRYWLLSDTGYWLLSDIGYWLLSDIGYWLLSDIGYCHSNYVLRYLNTKHPTIKFELALPESDGFLPILAYSWPKNEVQRGWFHVTKTLPKNSQPRHYAPLSVSPPGDNKTSHRS